MVILPVPRGCLYFEIALNLAENGPIRYAPPSGIWVLREHQIAGEVIAVELDDRCIGNFRAAGAVSEFVWYEFEHVACGEEVGQRWVAKCGLGSGRYYGYGDSEGHSVREVAGFAHLRMQSKF